MSSRLPGTWQSPCALCCCIMAWPCVTTASPWAPAPTSLSSHSGALGFIEGLPSHEESWVPKTSCFHALPHGERWEKVQEKPRPAGGEKGCSSGSQMKTGASSQESVMAEKTSEFWSSSSSSSGYIRLVYSLLWSPCTWEQRMLILKSLPFQTCLVVFTVYYIILVRATGRSWFVKHHRNNSDVALSNFFPYCLFRSAQPLEKCIICFLLMEYLMMKINCYCCLLCISHKADTAQRRNQILFF